MEEPKNNPDSKGQCPLAGFGAEPQSIIRQSLSPFDPLFDAFHEAGFELYAVGGCVRDWVLGKSPKDIDFTTDALPDETRQILASHGYKVIPVGELFGTIATIIAHKTYEITTFRVKESYTRGSRHPIVCYGKSLERDLERRDLTINAMAASQNGDIIDPFDGLGDLKAGLLRVPRSSYEKTIEIFGDDPLRILRLARFKARLGFKVCDETTHAARDVAGSVLTVSRERWFAEIDGMLRAADPRAGLDWLCEIGLFQMLFPEFALLMQSHIQPTSLSGCQAKSCADTLWAQTIRRIEAASPELRWIALFSLVGYASTTNGKWAQTITAMIAGELMSRLKFSNARVDATLKCLQPLPPGDPQYRSARELAISLENEIHDWYAAIQNHLTTLPNNVRTSESERLSRWHDALAPYFAAPKTAEVRMIPGLSQHLTEALGVRGKTLGLCIAHCREAILDQKLSESDTIDKYIDWVRDHFEDSGE